MRLPAYHSCARLSRCRPPRSPERRAAAVVAVAAPGLAAAARPQPRGRPPLPRRPLRAQVVRLSGVVNASGDGITLTAAASGTQNHPLTITGEAPANEVGATIDIEAATPNAVAWSQVATAVIGSGGAFSARWVPTTSAQVELRAVLAPTTTSGGGSGTSGGSGLPGAGLGRGSVERPRDSSAHDPDLQKRRGDDLRARLLGPSHRLWRAADPDNAWRRQPHAQVRHPRCRVLQGPRAHGARDRPGPVRQRRKLGSDDGDRQGAGRPGDRDGRHPLASSRAGDSCAPS